MTTVMIMAGGTGGHVYPALSVGQHLRAQGVEVVWLGTRKGLEARVVPNAGFQMEWLEIKGLVGTSWMRKLAMPWMLLRAVTQALRIMRRRMPDAVLGMGGFAAGPGGIAAWLLRRPLVIHEANAVCGVTNRLLAPFSKHMLTGFQNVRHLGTRAKWTGNPVRQEIVRSISTEDPINAAQPLRLLVLGGTVWVLWQLATTGGRPRWAHGQPPRLEHASARDGRREEVFGSRQRQVLHRHRNLELIESS